MQSVRRNDALIHVAVVFVSSSMYLLHLGAALIVLGVVVMIEADYISIMYYWNIDLNAISAVNRMYKQWRKPIDYGN